MNRRHVLRGLGGAVLALPVLEGLVGRVAGAADKLPPFALFVRQANGVQQATKDGEPERFWPSAAPGPLSPQALAADSDRTLSLLADHAANLSIVRGINFGRIGNACAHSGGGNQVLTAALTSNKACNSTLALGESLDNRIATQLGAPGEEPLTLYAGLKLGYLDEVLSYRGPLQLRGAERSPAQAYANVFALAGLQPAELALLRTRRKSINDLVRDELSGLLARTDLSKADRQRLDLHFTSIRDLENGIAGMLTDEQVIALEAGSTASQLDNDDNIEAIFKLHCDVMVLAIATGARRTATLQIGAGPDETRYWVGGVKQAPFHLISHRGVENAMELHHQIDRIITGYFKYLLDKLAEYSLPTGSLLDHGVTVFCNDLADKFHSYKNVPYILAGTAGGALNTGLYVDAGGVTNNKLLNVIGAAVGCTNAQGGPLDDFGDPGWAPGFVDGLLTQV